VKIVPVFAEGPVIHGVVIRNLKSDSRILDDYHGVLCRVYAFNLQLGGLGDTFIHRAHVRFADQERINCMGCLCAPSDGKAP